MITFSYPSGDWNFIRSYITRLLITDDPGTISIDDNTITLTIPGYPHYIHVFVINPAIWVWSSNCYTLTFLMVDGWYEFGDTTHHDFGATLTLLPNPETGFFFLKLDVPGSAEVEHEIPLTGGPGGYWLNPVS